MHINWSTIENPFLDREPAASVRDPALVLHEGRLHCFHTAVERAGGRYRLFLDVTATSDLRTWDPPRRLTFSDDNYSSPGNALRVGATWRLCVQSYPIAAGEQYGSEASRLWLMESADLVNWSAPRPIAPQGCATRWARSRRQIDPYIVADGGRYWCFYKAQGCLGLLASDDLEHWEEASPNRPVLGPEDTPDGATVENPCVLRDGDDWVLFFAPCRQGRGIGTARSDDLLHWRDVRYLPFPDLSWATGGPTAAMVLDARETLGAYLMAFHGEQPSRLGAREDPHSAALGLAWSDDLQTWRLPGSGC